VKKRPYQNNEARQLAMTRYLIIVATALATFLALSLAVRYL